MSYIRGQAITGFPFGLVDRSTGNIITSGNVDVYITIDGGDQFEAANEPVHKNNGQWVVNFNGNETNGTFIGIMIVHADAIPQHFTIKTEELDLTEPVISVTVTSAGTSISDNFEYYGTIVAANLYFDYKLDSDCWDQATVKDREKALIAATRTIEKLNFAGSKHDEDQNLQFPRGNDTVIPIEIEYATYEIAIKFLEGVDNDIEAQSLGIMSESYTGIRTNIDPDFVSEHLRAGIPSIEAWGYLKPFLRDSRQVNIVRVN